ncbi:unnamed protein product [Somion occarium]|uniref:Uncharacterized protein n=1 Tax=Somion occarium TaxID=3059160 RepID=A0ABP1DDJ8_9APHY
MPCLCLRSFLPHCRTPSERRCHTGTHQTLPLPSASRPIRLSICALHVGSCPSDDSHSDMTLLAVACPRVPRKIHDSDTYQPRCTCYLSEEANNVDRLCHVPRGIGRQLLDSAGTRSYIRAQRISQEIGCIDRYHVSKPCVRFLRGTTVLNYIRSPGLINAGPSLGTAYVQSGRGHRTV